MRNAIFGQMHVVVLLMHKSKRQSADEFEPVALINLAVINRLSSPAVGRNTPVAKFFYGLRFRDQLAFSSEKQKHCGEDDLYAVRDVWNFMTNNFSHEKRHYEEMSHLSGYLTTLSNIIFKIINKKNMDM